MSDMMRRVNNIIRNPKYRSCLAEIASYEAERKFCRHTLEHSLDTARIMYITALENGLNFSKDMIYAAALLHDTGRAAEYKTDIPHDTASAEFAGEILDECGFSESETETIVSAVLCHRTRSDGSFKSLGELLCFADKKSRLCFACAVKDECYWSDEKKNGEITL